MNPKWNGQFSCFDLVARTDACASSVVRVGNLEIGGGDFIVMAGPCAVESEQQLLRTAEAVAAAGARMLRGGAYKPRSSPYAFQGLGVEGLKLLRKAREETGLAIVTEVMSEEDVDSDRRVCRSHASGHAQHGELRAARKTGRMRAAGAAEARDDRDFGRAAAFRASDCDGTRNPQIVLCERGIRTFETATRNTLDIAAVPVLKDGFASARDCRSESRRRSAGLVPVLSRAAVVVGADGLLVEVHPSPDHAMSDGRAIAYLSRFPRHDGGSATLLGDPRCYPAR